MAQTYLDRFPQPLRNPGNHRLGEIELLVPGPEENEYGVFYEDRYILVVRDKVRFPDGNTGGYIRIFHQSDLSGGSGTVIVPVMGRSVCFIRIFRHATRGWEWELPRGFQEPDLDEVENARKELHEELGGTVETVERLGEINSNTGLMYGKIGVYLARLEEGSIRQPSPEQAEAIQAWEAVEEEKLADFILEKKVVCGISLAALMLYLHRRTKQ